MEKLLTIGSPQVKNIGLTNSIFNNLIPCPPLKQINQLFQISVLEIATKQRTGKETQTKTFFVNKATTSTLYHMLESILNCI